MPQHSFVSTARCAVPQGWTQHTLHYWTVLRWASVRRAAGQDSSISGLPWCCAVSCASGRLACWHASREPDGGGLDVPLLCLIACSARLWGEPTPALDGMLVLKIGQATCSTPPAPALIIYLPLQAMGKAILCSPLLGSDACSHVGLVGRGAGACDVPRACAAE
jgi:hypothetical protein